MALQEASGDGQDGDHSSDDMLRTHHRNRLWIPWTLILLGAWLVVAPFSFGYLNEELWPTPSGGRGAWFAQRETYDTLRATLMTWSDVVSGVALMVLGWRALVPDRPVSRWAACFVGIWVTVGRVGWVLAVGHFFAPSLYERLAPLAIRTPVSSRRRRPTRPATCSSRCRGGTALQAAGAGPSASPAPGSRPGWPAWPAPCWRLGHSGGWADDGGGHGTRSASEVRRSPGGQ